MGVAPSPLVEPDVQISRIRLARGLFHRRVSQAVDDLQPLEPFLSEMGVKAFAFGQLVGSLTGATQESPEALKDVVVNAPHGSSGMPVVEVLSPASDLLTCGI